MPSASQSLFEAQAKASAGDWAEVEGSAYADLKADVELNRGFNLGVGMKMGTEIDASVQKYVAAQLGAEASAAAELTVQAQVPMNLFDKMGIEAKMMAKAEAAAGVRLALGLSAGGFVKLVESDAMMQGLPTQLFRIFMDEVTVTGGLYAKVAVSAMAYANLVVAGTAIKTRDAYPGFQVMGEMGVGLAYGAGYRFFGNFSFANFDRCIGRSIDVAVDSSVQQIKQKIGKESPSNATVIDAFGLPAKIALRNAYDLGVFLSENKIKNDSAGAKQMAQKCLTVILEESQRYVIKKLQQYGLDSFNDYVSSQIQEMTSAQKQKIQEKQNDFEELFMQMPTESVASEYSKDHWISLVDKAVYLGAEIDKTKRDESWLYYASSLWSATQLLILTTQRMTQASASASFGKTVKEVTAELDGKLETQPPKAIRDFIKEQLGSKASSDSNLNKKDLVKFLTQEHILEPALEKYPELGIILDIFEQFQGKSSLDMLKSLIEGTTSAIPNSDDNPGSSLQKIRKKLSAFITSKIDRQLSTTIKNTLGATSDAYRFFSEVILASVRLTADVVFFEIACWKKTDVTADTIKETLSSVLMMLFGRTIVSATDVLLYKTQSQIKKLMNDTSKKIESLGLLSFFQKKYPSIAKSVLLGRLQLALKLGGEVLGPLSSKSRTRIRDALYEIMESVPKAKQKNFVENLKDSDFIPSKKHLIAVAKELGKEAVKRVSKFIAKWFVEYPKLFLTEYRDFIKAAIRKIKKWIAALKESLAKVKARVDVIAKQITNIAVKIKQLLKKAKDTMSSIFSAFSSSSNRSAIRKDFANYLTKIFEARLKKNAIYKKLPKELKVTTVGLMKKAIEAVIAKSLTQKIKNTFSLNVDKILQKIEDLGTKATNLGVKNAIFEELKEKLQRSFGKKNPNINIEFDIPILKKKKRISLGNFSLSLDYVFSVIKKLAEKISSFKSKVASVVKDCVSTAKQKREQLVKQVQKQALEKERTRLNDLIKQNEKMPTKIQITKPKNGFAYEKKIDVEINIPNITKEYLGTKKEPQRVFVMHNGKSTSLDSFSVQEATILGTTGLKLNKTELQSKFSKGLNSLAVSVVNANGKTKDESIGFIVSKATISHKNI